MNAFDKIARATEHAVGSPWAFFLAVATVVVWAITGPFFGWSDTWQLVINTGTTVATYLIVFLIQSTQSRDTRAIHLKLDELISVIGPARNELTLAEQMSEAELERLLAEIRARAAS